jgi:hypothetical protein
MKDGNPDANPCRKATLVAIAVCIVSATFALSSNRADAAALKPIRWLFNGPGVSAMAENAEASHLLDDTQPFVVWGRPLRGVPQSWHAVHVISFKSFSEIKDALETGSLGPEIKGVMYDYEKWRFTPADEQRNPAAYLKKAADLVHSKGLLFLTAPAVNLVTVMAPGASRNRLYETYLQLGIAADAARYADVVDIQAQRFERDADTYAVFVRQAAAQARQANPNVMVLAGVSTEPIGQSATADDIFNAIDATRQVVDGYWLNIPQPSNYSPTAKEFRPDIAVDVLRRLAGS